MLTAEQWCPVVGYEHLYQISDHGHVWSNRSNRLLNFNKDRKGYLLVSLSSNGDCRTKKVHRLVLEAFVGPCPPGLVTCHTNDIHSDNRLENLRWDTYSANQYEQVRNGKHPQASKTHCKHGHEYTPANTQLLTGTQLGHRRCRECERRRYERRERHGGCRPLATAFHAQSAGAESAKQKAVK